MDCALWSIILKTLFCGVCRRHFEQKIDFDSRQHQEIAFAKAHPNEVERRRGQLRFGEEGKRSRKEDQRTSYNFFSLMETRMYSGVLVNLQISGVSCLPTGWQKRLEQHKCCTRALQVVPSHATRCHPDQLFQAGTSISPPVTCRVYI